MDRHGDTFGAHDAPGGRDPHYLGDAGDGWPSDDFDAPLAPPSPVGQDERRMQVRAYNHWASLLGSGDFPDIANLQPETLEDFGPYGVLLDFGGKRGVDDPAIRFLGAKLAEECGGEARFKRLSEVPGLSLLSRITDHYLQILANRAPIGFEAEFTNGRGAAVLYRGILLPWSSDGETIDYIFGVINWKELADAATADALLDEIDATATTPQAAHHEGQDMDRMLDLTAFSAPRSDGVEDGASLPRPAFGVENEAEDAPLELVDALSEDEETEEEAEDSADASEWGAGFSGFGEDDKVYAVDYGAQGLEDGEEDEDVEGVVDPLGDESASLGLAALVARGARVKQSVALPGMGGDDAVPLAPAGFAMPESYEPADPPPPLTRAPVFAPEPEPQPEPELETELDLEALVDTDEEADGLYDCLAAARELAQTARSSEDRGRKALYQAVARAYDFSLEAAANPADFDELLAENGLTVQDRAPMTPIVKLVFGADYDKTRLTEYATVLGHAHRTGVARGTLENVLARAEGGLKGIVQAERRARREAEGRPDSAPREEVRAGLAKRLRKLDPVALDALPAEGAEFALVMVRRLPTGELAVLGEVPGDIALVEKAARKLLA